MLIMLIPENNPNVPPEKLKFGECVVLVNLICFVNFILLLPILDNVSANVTRWVLFIRISFLFSIWKLTLGLRQCRLAKTKSIFFVIV